MSRYRRCPVCDTPFCALRTTGKFCTNKCRQKMYRFIRRENAELKNPLSRRYAGDRYRNEKEGGFAEQESALGVGGQGRQGSEASSSSTKTPSTAQMLLEEKTRLGGNVVASRKRKAAPNE